MIYRNQTKNLINKNGVRKKLKFQIMAIVMEIMIILKFKLQILIMINPKLKIKI